jgi:hypothetical protein
VQGGTGGMAELTLKQIIDLVSSFGIPGIIIIIWYFSEKSHERTLRAYREDVQRTLTQYHEEMIEQRRMYENNVELVKNCLDVSHNLKDVIILNTQSLTSLRDDINKNQFCPMVRLRKEALGVQA